MVTLPKVTDVRQVEAMALVCERLEEANGLAEGRLRFEIQVETPQSILAADGTATVARMVQAAGTGVRLSDGSTNLLPVGGTEAVHAAWRLHARLVRRSLERGYWQGWDLHPAQLPTRYLATYAFFREGLPAAAARLPAYAERTAGGVLDEPATAQALAGFLARGLDCGALTEAEVTGHTGLDRAAVDQFARRSGRD